MVGLSKENYQDDRIDVTALVTPTAGQMRSSSPQCDQTAAGMPRPT
jgi:hypothetical protein